MRLCLGESCAGSSQTDPSLLAVFYDYIKLMPMVAEANQMSQELDKVAQIHSHWPSMLNVFFVFLVNTGGSYVGK